MVRQILHTKVEWRIPLLIIGLLSLFLLTQWNTLNGPFERDEGEYAYAAWIMKEGLVPYQDSFMQKPPMIIYTYWFAQLLSDSAFWPPRLLGSIFVALTAILIGVIVRKEYGSTSGWISVWIFLPLWCLPHLLPFAANTEKFMNLPMMGTLAIYVLYGRSRSNWIWVAAGASASLALLYKPISLMVLLFVFLVWAVETWRYGPGAAGTIKSLTLALCGALLIALVTLLYFVASGAIDELWESCFLYNRFYAQMSWAPDYFLRKIHIMLRSWWVLFALLLWFLIHRPGRWWFYFTLFMVALATAYKDPNGHYYLMVLPFWAIICGAALGSGIETLRKSWLKPGKTLTAAAVCLVAALLCLPARYQFRLSPSELYRWAYGPGNPFHESPLVAKHVAALSSPDDCVFVAGSEPQILYYAKRKSPTRFVIMYPLMIPSPYAEKYQTETIQAIQARQPTLIVLSNSHYSWLAGPGTPDLLLSFLNGLFQSGTYQLAGGFRWMQDQGTWVEPIDPDTARQCSLVILKRKSLDPQGQIL